MIRSHLAAIGVSAFVVASVLSETAQAFDYPEHAHISYRALAAVTSDCESRPPGARARCERALRLKRITEAELPAPLFCSPTELLDSDQPSTCFSLADVPALAGDHAASPLLTAWRWFRNSEQYHEQNKLYVALPGVVAVLNTSSRSPETTLIRLPDRRPFLEYMRQFAPRHWPQGSGPSDLELETFDDNYIGLAERGHPHFRPPLTPATALLASARVSLKYPKFDPKRRRGKPDSQAFAWYADQHLGALRLAYLASLHHPCLDENALLAAALFLELNAWHYLEDSVASGHMIGEAKVLNNGALSATHDRYCKGGVRARLGDAGDPGKAPPRPPLCDRLAAIAPAGTWPLMESLCDSATHEGILLGDHQILKGRADAQLAEQWASALAAESLSEVVRASDGETFHMDVATRALDDISDTTQWGNGADPADTWAPDAFDQYLFAWWEGNGDAHEKEISALFDTDAFLSLRSVPVPVASPGEALTVAYPSERFYSGNSLALAAFSYAYTSSFSHAAAIGRLGGGAHYLLAAPRGLAPVQLSLGAIVEAAPTGPADPRAAAELTFRMYYGSWSKVFFGAAGELGYVFDAKAAGGGGDLIPFGWTWLDKNRVLSSLEVRAGVTGFFGWRAGANATLAF
jgi:hypothetical protein